MTLDDIIRIAREAGAELYADTLIVNGKDAHDFIKRFAALVAAAEREECAKVAERATARKRTLYKMNNSLPELPPCAIAAAIRARGDKS